MRKLRYLNNQKMRELEGCSSCETKRLKASISSLDKLPSEVPMVLGVGVVTDFSIEVEVVEWAFGLYC